MSDDTTNKALNGHPDPAGAAATRAAANPAKAEARRPGGRRWDPTPAEDAAIGTRLRALIEKHHPEWAERANGQSTQVLFWIAALAAQSARQPDRFMEAYKAKDMFLKVPQTRGARSYHRARRLLVTLVLAGAHRRGELKWPADAT